MCREGVFYDDLYMSQFRYDAALASYDEKEPTEPKEMRPTGVPGADD